MGFGGAGSMNVVLKNNKRLLHKREHFAKSKIVGSYAKSEKPEYDFPKATPQMLRSIRKRLLFENEQRKKRRLIALAFALVTIITVFVVVLA